MNNTIKNILLSTGITGFLLIGLMSGGYLYKFLDTQKYLNSSMMKTIQMQQRDIAFNEKMFDAQTTVLDFFSTKLKKLEGSLEKSSTLNEELLCMITAVNDMNDQPHKFAVDLFDLCK